MKNRTVIGIICMILAVAITFGVAPMVSKMAEGKVDVLTFNKNLGKGSQITEDDLSVTSLLRSGLPEGAISAKSKTDVIGKYTNSDVYKGDVVTPSKLADDANASDHQVKQHCSTLFYLLSPITNECLLSNRVQENYHLYERKAVKL